MQHICLSVLNEKLPCLLKADLAGRLPCALGLSNTLLPQLPTLTTRDCYIARQKVGDVDADRCSMSQSDKNTAHKLRGPVYLQRPNTAINRG